MRRRKLLLDGVALGAIAVAREGVSAAERPTLKFGTTPVFLDEQTGFLGRWAAYLSAGTGMQVIFVQRRAYRDIVGMLRSGELDAAWLCGYPWVVNRQFLAGISVPSWDGQPWYRSYLIRNAQDRSISSFKDLAGKSFAYSDPDSNSGYLVPRAAMLTDGIDPERHFSRTFFTWGHRNVVTAVATGLAQSGAVDGYVWETLRRRRSAAAEATSVIWQSERYGFPPIVCRASLAAASQVKLQSALLGMSSDEQGKALLAELNLTGFGPFEASYFDGIAKLVAQRGVAAS